MAASKIDTLTVASLFSGCGGLDYGFLNAGYKIQWANEINPDAAKSYAKLIGHNAVVEDIWPIIDLVPNVDVVIGGPPCQSFSLVGKRLQDDPRGQLVFAYARIIERLKPKAFVMENVAGLMASRIDGKRLPLVLAEHYIRLGYEVSVLKLMATDFFVPQRRSRVVLIGHRCKGKEFRLIDSDEYAKILGMTQLFAPITVAEALDDLPTPNSKADFSPKPYLCDPHSAYSHLIRRNNPNNVSMHAMPTMSDLDREFVRHIPPGGNYVSIPDDIATIRIKKFKMAGGRTTTYGRLDPDKPAYTINTYFNRPNVGANYHHREERLITVREALRLQSFPDNFTPVYSNQRSLHMQIGNAVPPLMAGAIAHSLAKLFV